MTEADTIFRLNAAPEGRYRIERELGEGGMATVYLANVLQHESCAPRLILTGEEPIGSVALRAPPIPPAKNRL